MRSVFVEGAGNYPKDAYVGVYWFVRDDSGTVLLIAHRCALSEAEEYGDFLTCPHGHYDLWETWRGGGETDRLRGTLRDCEYEEWPRGRVVFNTVNGQFIVHGDAQVFKYELQQGVTEHFGIPAGRVVFMRDEHYRSTRSLQ